MTEPMISMRIIPAEDGTFTVELDVTGLKDEAQAEAAMLHMQNLFCGEQFQIQ